MTFKERFLHLRFLYLLLGLNLIIMIQFFTPPFAAAAERPQKEKILVNFVDVDIVTVADFISKLTGKNFIYDERVAGKVTIIAPTKVDVEEAFNLFVSVLELKGYSIVFTGTAYKIIPSAGIKQGAIGVYEKKKGLKVNEAYIARLISLTYVQVQDILPMLQPLVSRDGYISVFGKGNLFLIVDNALNIEKILRIVKLIDSDPRINIPHIVYLKNAQAEAVANTLKQIGSAGASMRISTKGGPQPSPETIGPIPDKRLNALILFGSHEENEIYKRLIAIIDAPSPEASSRINVYYLENAEAGELAKVIEGITKQALPGAPPSPVSTETTGRIAVTPDKITNSLVIMASPDDYQNLVQVIKKLDRRPKQVFVEVMITEVSIDKSLELGTKWRAAGTKDGKPVAIGGVGTIDSSAIQNIISGMSGLTIGGLANFITVPVTKPDGTTTNLTTPGFAALFSLSDFKSAINVLSTPHILTSNNKEAEILVGENVPFLSKMERESATTGQPLLQSIERKDVGISLKIKPQISEGDYIKLDIYQEISAIALTAVGATDILTTKRSAKTSVVVKDKQTIVIGGLIQDKEIETINKVPLLGDIPLLGWLFKFKSKAKQKTNLLLYLTPTIVKDFDELEGLRERKKDEFKEGVKEEQGSERNKDIKEGEEERPEDKRDKEEYEE